MPRFVLIGDKQDSGALIFLEDTAILRHQAQQLKMAALARLTASIAHEIRNPLGAITNAAQLLGESAATPTGEEQRLLRIIGDQSRRMNVIVENVMQLSRRDHVNPKRVALGAWLREFVSQFCDSVRMPTDAIAVLEESPVRVCMDVDQLYQVVGNLCQNAFRHSGAFSGERSVELRYGSDGGDPYLDVVDWGSGITPEVADNIFDPFFTTTPKGTGLGLYIARELCEGNGGRLDYYPGEGVGSRFRITFSKAEHCAEIT
jgi:two-component system sensor histidine kinase PilS (NtrC family)